MKKIISVIILVCLLTSSSSCGKVDSKNPEKAGHESNMLPTRIEKINEGGVIPEGAEATVPVDSVPQYPMLWGEWVLDVEDIYNANPTDVSIKIKDEENLKSYVVEDPQYIECLPYSFEFSASWASGRKLRSLGPKFIARDNIYNENNNLIYTGGYYEKRMEVEWDYDPLGEFVESRGYGFGVARYRGEETKNTSGITPILTGNEREVIYSLKDNKLAIGLTNIYTDDDAVETDIIEIDYDVSFTGYRLTLSYGDETATYVPMEMSTATGEPKFILDNLGPVADDYTIDGIEGISESVIEKNNGILLTDIHDGFVKADYDFNEDGTLNIKIEDGEQFHFRYKYAGATLTLIDGNDFGIYSMYSYVMPSPNNGVPREIYINKTKFSDYYSPQKLLDFGFNTDYDLNQSILSGSVTEEIVFELNGSKIKAKLCNPYDVSMSAIECDVCSVKLDSESGVITKGDGSIIGETTYDWIDFFYEPALEKTEQSIRYKEGGIKPIELISVDALDGPHRIYDDGDMEIVYEFEDKVLKDIRMEWPGLLYAGLQDNVDRSLLEAMEPKAFSGVIKVRDTILDRLKASFEQSNVDVDINDSTGEIVMANDVLFGFDEDTLSDEGKRYIDNFIGSYVSVLTADEISRYISQINFEGHTDSTGTYTYNLGLSQRRAEAVMNYCVDSETNGLNDEQKARLKKLSVATGYAFTDPVFNDQGKEDPEASRRAAIKFFVNVEEGDIESNSELNTQGSVSGNSLIDTNAIIFGMEGYGEYAIMILPYNKFFSIEYEYDSEGTVTGGKQYNATLPGEVFKVEYDSKRIADKIVFGDFVRNIYDTDWNLYRQERFDDTGKVLYCELNYSYDSIGRLVKESLVWRDENTSDKLGELGYITYRYGSDGRMSGADFIWDESILYHAEYDYPDDKTRIERFYYWDTDILVGEYECKYHGNGKDGMLESRIFTYKNRCLLLYDSISDDGKRISVPDGNPFTFPEDVFQEQGHEFLGWSNDVNSTIPDYKAGEKIKADDVADFMDGASKKMIYGVWR